MCCIIHRPKGTKEISKEYLEKIIKKNPHGWGISYFKNKKLYCEKSMDMDKSIDVIRNLEKDDIEFVFHARWATHGDKDIENCHPYAVKNGYLFHNGTIKIFRWNPKMSDTWHFCRRYSKLIKANKSVENILSRFNANLNGSRICVITNEGNIIKEGKWEEIDGCFYSKTDWRYKTTYNEDYHYGGYSYYSTPSIKNEVKNIKSDISDIMRDLKMGIFKISSIMKLSHNELCKLLKDYPFPFARFFKENMKELKDRID